MASPLEELLTAAANDPDRDVQPTYDFVGNLCYRTKGEADRPAGLKTILEGLYLSITTENYEHAERWTDALEVWMTLEHNVPRKVRVALVKIYYDLALTPGMDSSAAQVFCDMVPRLVNNVEGELCLDPGKDLTLDWRTLFERLKHDYLRTYSTILNPIDYDDLALVARYFFDPGERLAVAEEILPYFDTGDSQAAVRAVIMMALMSPTQPAPEASSDCQPSSLLPMHFSLFAKLFRTQVATEVLMRIVSPLAQNHLTCKHVPFGAFGIFDEMQSRELFAAISRLALIDDRRSDDSFHDGSLSWHRRMRAARNAADWIVFSLSPLCSEKQNSMLSGLESLIASITVLYHPNSTILAQLDFITNLLWYIIHSFCKRYHREQSGELDTPAERRINDELRGAFVRLLRDPILAGCFSMCSDTRFNCSNAVKPLADLEPGLIIPTALQRFYASHDSMVDGDAAEFSMRLLVVLGSTIAREKGLRCHLPHLMNLALSGINASRPDLTRASCQFIRVVTCDPPAPHLQFAKPGTGKPKHPDAAKAWKAWIKGEIERLNDGGSVIDLDYRKQLSDEEEIDLLQSGFSSVEDFTLRLLKCVFKFASDAFHSDFVAEHATGADRNEAELDVLEAVLSCFMSLPPEMLEEAMLALSKHVLSDPIPEAKNLISSIVVYAVRADPKSGLRILLPALVHRIHDIIKEHWIEPRVKRCNILAADDYLNYHVEVLGFCLMRGGSELLAYKDQVLELTRFARDQCGSRACALCARLNDCMVTGLVETYPMTCAVTYDGQGEVATTAVAWHTPSPDELRAACEVFTSETVWLGETIDALMEDYPTSAKERGTWGQSLTQAVKYLNNILCGMSPVFDPGREPAAGGNVGNPCDENAKGEAALVSAHVQEFHRVLEPDDPLYDSVHQRRREVGLLAGKIHAFLLKCEGEHAECLREVYRLCTTLIGDVGRCHTHRDAREPRRDHKRWAKRLDVEGRAPAHPPAICVMLMERYHEEMQEFGTGYRHMGDLERRVLEDVTEGCSSPYESVRSAGRYLLVLASEMLVDSAKFFLPLMLAKVRDLIKSGNHRGIEGAVQTLVWGIPLWKQHCPSLLPHLLGILATTAAMDVPQVAGIAAVAKGGLTYMGCPKFRGRTVFPRDGIAESIRPAGDFSDLAVRAHELQRQNKDEVLQKMEDLGVDLLRMKTDPQLCILAIPALILPSFDPPPVELLSFLADNAVAADAKLRHPCISMLGEVGNMFLLGIPFAHDLEHYIRTQGCGGGDLVQVVPSRDVACAEQYLTEYAKLGDGDDSGDGTFFDPSSYGSLVWPARFHAWRKDTKLPTDDPEMARKAACIGSLFTKEWFEKFLSHLKLEEEPWEGDKNGQTPVIWSSNYGLLIHVFRLMELGATAAKLEDVEDLVKTALEDGTKIGHHLAAATLLLGLLWAPRSSAFRSRVLKTAEPLLIDILEHKMSLAGGTWAMFLRRLIKNRDPRRVPGLVRHVSSLQLDVEDAAPNNNAKLDTIQTVLRYQGWRFRQDNDVLSMLLGAKDVITNVEVSASLGTTLALIYTPRFHDSWTDVRTMIAANRDASSFGIRPYEPRNEIRDTVSKIFERVSALRKQEPIPHREYQSATSVALAFVFGMFETNASGVLVHMVDLILDDLFFMLDAKLPEKSELEVLATSALEKLCRLPFRGDDEPAAFWKAIVNKAGKSEPITHRKAAMSMMRELYLRRLFTSTPDEQRGALQAVSDKIQDSDSKIHTKAAETLKHLLSRSRLTVTGPIINDIVDHSVEALRATAIKDSVRLAAVWRLSATVSAYPHLIEAPKWMEKAMTSLVHEAQLHSSLSTNIARTTVRDFKEAKRTQWETVTKALISRPQHLPEKLVLEMQEMMGPSYYA
ncbi:hypothetical protein AYO21_11175 [Fonsecaea monophora]|uniref:Proteasome activator Blm10 mid region domain-containing protein n=1 Tax=Fonsecaea monophora TaxID=254056 RepID=A0A177ERN4_9EURO|nr:hypothetical protein AYO21_11175 [Fonsecaea monophora]OAG34663.1 hypothetical protein AYO21_11175 [Fonsecaea monophora]